jgi:hypothetical protein
VKFSFQAGSALWATPYAGQHKQMNANIFDHSFIFAPRK